MNKKKSQSLEEKNSPICFFKARMKSSLSSSGEDRVVREIPKHNLTVSD
jgi:hypothetical protein